MNIIEKMKAAFVDGISDTLPQPYKDDAKDGARILGGKLANAVIDHVEENSGGGVTMNLTFLVNGALRRMVIVDGLVKSVNVVGD